MPEFDIAVIGSGPAGLHAAFSALSDKTNVAMIDVGFDGSKTTETESNASFEDVRRGDISQGRIFLGDDFSGLKPLDKNSSHAGSMTSGRRAYVIEGVDKYLPVKGNDALVIQSLARGGLSEAWGAVCGFFDEGECDAAGIPFKEIKKHYETVISRIGVSGLNEEFKLQPPAHIDENAQVVLERFQAKKDQFARFGFSVERPPLALLTQDLGSRKKTEYRDMDFWDNAGRSVYRGHQTLETLLGKNNFKYFDRRLVMSLENKSDHVIIHVKNIETGSKEMFKARAVIVAAGAFNTTRILLRSFSFYDVKVPVIIKSNYILPCLSLPRFGRSPRLKKHSLCQLTISGMERSGGMTGVYGQLYSYSSLLLHKLLRYVPMPKPEALKALSIMVPSMMLVDVRFPSIFSEEKFATLKKDGQGGDFLEINYKRADKDDMSDREQLKKLKKALMKLSLIPLRTVANLSGATAHYAGGVQVTDSANGRMLSSDSYGCLHKAKRVFVADSAIWKTLPAKPPALTIMANASRIGERVKEMIIKSEL